LAIVTNVGAGCGGRSSVGHDEIAGRALPVSDPQACKTNGAEADGEVVWS
jgi:hypothetical protein